MALRREQGRQKCQIGPGARRMPQFARIMRRTRDPRAKRHFRSARPVAPASPEMHSGPKSGRQPRIPRDHQGQPAIPANPGQVPAQSSPSHGTVMAQHDTAQPLRQAFHSSARVGQPDHIGEQPQHWKTAPAKGFRLKPLPRLDGAGPGDKLLIHERTLP